jgi:flagellar hook-length control protein FliK
MAGLVPININLVNAGSSPLFAGTPQGGIGQGNDSNDFMSVLSAIFAGLNGSMMGMVPQEGSDGKQFNLEALLQGLKVESDGETVSGEDALDILKNFLLNANAPQVVMAGIDNSRSQGMSDAVYSQIPVQALAQMTNQPVNIPISSETSGQSQSAILDGNNALIQLKMMMKPDSEMKSSALMQTPDKVFDNIINPDNIKAADSQAVDAVMAKLQKGYSDFGKDFGSAVKEAATSMADSIKTDDVKPLFKGLANAESELMSQDTSKNSLSAAVSHSVEKPAEAHNAAPKETIHITRIGELGEPIMKTIGAGEKYLIIKLDPPDMGTVQIKLTLQNGELKADFKVESQAVKEMLSTAMPQIKAALEDAGIKSSNFFVNVRDEFQQQGGGEKKQQGENADGRQQQQKNNDDKEPKQKFSDFFA